MTKARIIIGANYGDEGKGTVAAHYTKNAEGRVLNVLTNGGAQRGHSILTEEGSITFQHFGSGTYHGADNYYSCYFILNPMQFVGEYNELKVKPKNIYRDNTCRWTTPYDSLANLIMQTLEKRQASCGMGIWNTIKRYKEIPCCTFNDFNKKSNIDKIDYLLLIRNYYAKFLTIPDNLKNVWNSLGLIQHFIDDCKKMYELTDVYKLEDIIPYYDEVIFENGQGLLLCDTGKDTYDTTPSNTGILYSLNLLKTIPEIDITAHYVTRPYLTRHGDGDINGTYEIENKHFISEGIQDDRTNHYNEFQGEFRYGFLKIEDLKERILSDSRNIKFELEVTHCDEMDRITEFNKHFNTVNTYDSALIK